MSRNQMLVLQIMLCISTITQSAITQCPSYSCAGASPDPGLECLTKTSGTSPIQTFNIYSCPPQNVGSYKRYTCDSPLSTPSTNPYPRKCESRSQTPGSTSSNPQSCYEGVESNGYCRGTAAGEQCGGTTMCDVGTYCCKGTSCTSTTCTKSSVPYTGTCSLMYDCPPLYACHQGTCTKYGSLPNGSNFTVFTALSQAWVCQSYWVDPTTLQCADGYSVVGGARINPATDTCGIIYNGLNVGKTWFNSHLKLLNSLAKGSCCYSPDGLSQCPLSTAQQKTYIETVIYIYIYIQFIANVLREREFTHISSWDRELFH